MDLQRKWLSNLQVVSKCGMISFDNAHIILLEIILKINVSYSSRVDFTEYRDKLKLVEDILSMMEKLHICYIVHDKQTINIPSTLKDNLDHSIIHWSRSFPSTGGFLHEGRQFICKNVMWTMLSPGIFSTIAD